MRQRAWTVLLASLLPLFAGSGAGEAGTRLLPDRPVERETGAGEAHLYEISLEAGLFARLVVEQHGIDVAVTATRTPGGPLLLVNNPDEQHATEVLSLLAEAAETWRLEVRALPGSAGRGSYRLRIEELRREAPGDRTRILAERAEAAADQLYLLRTADGYRQGLAAYRSALDRWREAGDPSKQAEILYRLGVTQRRLGDRRAALELLEEALALQRSQGNRSWQATILNQKGLILAGLGESAAALAALEEALALRRELNDLEREAPVLNNIGLVHHFQGNLRPARAAYAEVLEIFRRLGDLRGEAAVLGNLGSVHDGLGEPLEALRFLGEELELARALEDRGLQGTALNNVGLVKHKLGEAQAALESYSAALEIFRQVGDRPQEANALTNLGTLSLELGEPEPALSPFGLALKIQRETGARAGEAATLLNLGRAEAALGRSGEALEAFGQALAIQREIGDRTGEAATLSHLGSHLTSQGRAREALDPLRRALSLSRETGDRPAEARALHNLGAAFNALGDSAAALPPLTEALQLRRAVRDPVGEVAALQEIARAEAARGRLAEALVSLETSLDLIESLRLRISADRLRSSYLASLHDSYELAIDVLMRLHEREPEAGLAARAFEISERGRARSLLDLLREARVEIRRGADPALLEEERRLRIELHAKAERQTRLLGERHTEEQAAEARREVEEAIASYSLIESKLRAALPSYAGLTRPAAVSLREVQSLLDEETVLLEYSLGTRQSVLWAVTPSSFSVHALPGRSAIEAAAGELLGLLREPDPRGNPQRRALLGRLGSMLLGPVADRLPGKRLAIVASGSLQYVPFAALTLPAGEPLVMRHEIVSLPSGAVLAELRQNAVRRPSASGELAVLADPVFQPEDPRVANPGLAAATGNALPADLERLARDLGPAGFQRLPWSRQEAEAAAAQADGRPVLLALDFDANLETATGAGLGRYRRLHFATHGLLDDRHPEISGLVLSLVDAAGRPRDGFLRLTDVYNLELGAELVVLSGCQTALGRQVRGEGLIGLTRGFFYAGASQVVASLWPVRDRATAELMARFYRALLQEGRKPAAALRAAQLSMLREPRWRDPFYWAPFTASGDW